MPESQKKSGGVRRLFSSVKKSLKSSGKNNNQASTGQPASQATPGAYTAVPTTAPPAAPPQGRTMYSAPGPFHPDVIAAANRAVAAAPSPVVPAAPTPPQPPASAPPAPAPVPNRYSTQQVVPQDWRDKQAEEWARKKAEVDAIWSGGGTKKTEAPPPAAQRRWTMAEMKDAQDKSKYVGHRNHVNPVLQDMMRDRFTKDQTIPEHKAKNDMDL